MSKNAEPPKPYSDEWKKRRLLEGHEFHPSKYRRRSDRTIRASWLTDAVEAGAKVDLENAIVVGPIRLTYATFHDQVVIRSTVFQGPVDLSYATFKRAVNFSRTTFRRGATFDSATFESDVFLDEARFPEGVADFVDADVHGVFQASGVTFGKGVRASFDRTICHKLAAFPRARFGGEANFLSARIEGTAQFSDARFKGPISFNRCAVQESAFFDSATFEKEANFVSARIGSQGVFSGTVFKGRAVFDRATIEETAFFDHATFEAATSFVSARIGDHAIFRHVRFNAGAKFDNAEVAGPAIFHRAEFGEGAEVSFDGTMFRQGAFFQNARFGSSASFRTAQFDVEGQFGRANFADAATFASCRFGGQANFDLVTFGAGVFFDHAQFAADARFVETDFRGNTASFRETTFRSLFFSDDERAALFSTPSVNLLGCTYDHIHIPDRRSRLDWAFPVGQVPKDRINGSCWQSVLYRQVPAARQPYTQLESCFRSAGRDATADNVYFLRRWRELKTKWFVGDPVSLLLLLLVGYGVRRWFLVAWIALLIGVGTLLFHGDGSVLPKEEDAGITSVASSSCSAPDSCRLSGAGSFWFTLNAFLPVDIPAGSEWKPSTRSVQGLGFITYESLSSTLRIAGWIMIPIGVAAFTGLLQRRTVAG